MLDVAGEDLGPGGLDASARTTPTAMTTSTRPAASPIVSPRATAMSAATAPSVATIGATIETLPTVSAVYARLRPPA